MEIAHLYPTVGNEQHNEYQILGEESDIMDILMENYAGKHGYREHPRFDFLA